VFGQSLAPESGQNTQFWEMLLTSTACGLGNAFDALITINHLFYEYIFS